MFDILPWKRNKDNHAKELRREIESMYDRFFEPDFMPSTYLFGKGKWGPKLDISEGRKDIKVGERNVWRLLPRMRSFAIGPIRNPERSYYRVVSTHRLKFGPLKFKKALNRNRKD